jgi:hypothetical protein
MKMQVPQNHNKYGVAMLVLAVMLGSGSVVASAGTKTSAPAPKAAPAAHPAAASHPAGGSTASHGATGSTASHGATTGAAHTSGPTANGSHTTTTTANHATTANGSHTTTAGGAAGHATTASTGHAGTGAAGAAGGHGNTASTPHGTTASNSKIDRPVPKGTSEHVTKSGSAIRTRSNGKVSDVHDAKRGMDVHHGLDGGRRVSVQRHDGSRLVAERGRRGYVERGYHFHGHDFARRSYYWHGHEYGRFYRGYGYRGLMLNVYAPGFYFGAPFYGWAYNPWAVPIAYGWGWGGSPWLGFYGGFFTPWAVYPSASFWLTDYLIAENLQAAYAARQEAAIAAGDAAAAGAPALSEDVKRQIADEVKAQLALENQEATQTAANQDVDPGSSGIARLLGDGHPHVFVVGGGLDLTDSTGAECAVSEGDALALRTPPAADATTADLVVLASKGGQECASGGTVAVNLTDLQEMQNHLRETIDTGLKELQAKQGKGGLPQAPPSAQAPPKESPYAEVAPPPDPQDEKDIQAQAQQADAAESEVAQAASQEGGTAIAATASAPAAPVTVALGQTMDQVKAILGKPMKTADLGPKTIYYYDGMKVVFKAGKVSDVE